MMPVCKWETCQKVYLQEQVIFLPLLKKQERQRAEAVPARCPLAQGVQGEADSCPGGQRMPRGPGAGRLRAGSPSLGKEGGLCWTPPRPESAGQGREPAITASGAVCAPGGVPLGAASLDFVIVCERPGREFQTFPPRPARAGHRWAQLPCLVGSGQGPGAGPGACLPLCPRAQRRYLRAGSGLSPPPAPFPLAVTRGASASPSASPLPLPGRPPHRALASAGRRHGAVPPRSTPSAESQGGGQGGGGPERSVASPAFPRPPSLLPSRSQSARREALLPLTPPREPPF